jgi:hypothetical protein
VNRTFEDYRVDVVQMVFWCLELHQQPLRCVPSSLSDEPTSSCSPDEEATSVYSQLSESLLTWPASSKSPFLSNRTHLVVQKSEDIMVYNSRLYIMEDEVTVLSIRNLAKPVSDWNLWSACD